MLGMLYVLLSFYVGYVLLKRFLPELTAVSRRTTLQGTAFKLPDWMVCIPASYLLGTLLMTWTTYIFVYLFHSTGQAMFWGNTISLTCFSVFSIIVIFKNKASYTASLRETMKYSGKRFDYLLSGNLVEIIFVLSVLLISTFLMFYTFFIKNNTMYVGSSVWSDFGPHLAVIRSFSWGDNFPTQYPHFAAGNIRYHFLFQFLAGNLEFLGLRLDWAFNLPSILSMVSFFMLLYSLSLILVGKPAVGILASILFFFRSSFAFFTFANDIKPVNFDNIISKALSNLDFIGKTEHENWGLWNQNVYANQRHLAFSLSILILIIIVMLPLFQSMLDKLKAARSKAIENSGRNKLSKKNSAKVDNTLKVKPKEYVIKWLSALISGRDSWLPQNLTRAITIGLVLGLISFWNGAVVIATLPILCFMAIFSKNRFEYLIIAVITVILSVVESNFFIGSAASTVSPQLNIGFLAPKKNDLFAILSYYTELLGILPYILFIGLLVLPKRYQWIGLGILTPIVILSAIKFMPSTAGDYKNLVFAAVLLYMVALHLFAGNIFSSIRGIRWLTLAFLSPLILATTVQLTPDINANHKFVIISTILINIIAAYLLHFLFISKKWVIRILAAALVCILTITGIEDLITLKNRNVSNRAITARTDDKTMKWVAENTYPDEIFLTEMHVLHPILLAGRKLFFGWPYYAWSAGYNTKEREAIYKQIYGGTDAGKVKELVKNNNIKYIVIENDNRNSKNYKLNEALIKSTFTQIFEDKDRGLVIYETN